VTDFQLSMICLTVVAWKLYDVGVSSAKSEVEGLKSELERYDQALVLVRDQSCPGCSYIAREALERKGEK
jgi:hypothetical protein